MDSALHIWEVLSSDLCPDSLLLYSMLFVEMVMSCKDKFTLYCLLLYYLSSVYNVCISKKCVIKTSTTKMGVLFL